MIDEPSYSKSKSQVKREMLELQALGERLLDLNKEQLEKLALPSSLEEAIYEAKRLHSRGAKRRQLQYIGKLMRDIEDTGRISDFFQQLEMKDQRLIAFHHMLESWRERLITEQGQDAITEFMTQYPDLDRQHFRHLIQNAKKERKSGKPVGAGKLLFRYLRDLQSTKGKTESDE